jgi:hypothetical protein
MWRELPDAADLGSFIEILGAFMRNLKTTILSLFIAGGAVFTTCSALVATDYIYKWKDGEGHSHYAQTVPTGQAYQKIAVASAQLASTDKDSSKDDPKDKSDAKSKVDGAIKAGAIKAGAAKTGAIRTTNLPSVPDPAIAEKKKKCEEAQKDANLLGSAPIVDMDIHNSGTPVRLTALEQAEQLAKMRQQVSLFCGK